MHTLLPTLRSGHVPRRRLLDLLAHWRSLRLVSITAPAGFGKSTLAAEWLGRLAQEGEDCAWLSINTANAEPALLLHDLVAALSAHAPEAAELLAAVEAGSMTHAQFMHSLARRLAHTARDIVLVLDDFHLLDADACALVQGLLDHAPPALHLVVLSRTAPALKTARLHLNATVLALDADALRFDHDEFDNFAHTGALAHFDAAQQQEIERRAEGWIAGLHMLAHSQRSLLDEYTDSEVLQHMPAALRRFLADVAPLPYLTPELCAAATGREIDECAAMLTVAESSLAFVGRLLHTSQTTRYRIHPLLLEALERERMQRDDCVPERILRQRAALHIAEAGDVDAALHLLSAEDEDSARQIIRHALRPALLRHELRTARRWLSRLTADAVAADAALAVDAGWLEYFAESPNLHAAVERMRSAVASATSDELRAEAAVLEALADFLGGAQASARALMDAAAQLPHRPDGLAAGYMQLFEGYVPHDPSDVQARIRHMHRAADVFQQIGHSHGVVESSVTQGYVKMRYANAAGTVASLQHAFGVMKIIGREHSVLAADAARVCTEMLYRMDRIPEALDMVERTRALLEICDADMHMSHLHYIHQLLEQLCRMAVDRSAPLADDGNDAQQWASTLAHCEIGDACGAAILRIMRDQRLGLSERCWQTAESIAILPAELTDDMHDVVWYTVLAGSVHGGHITEAVEERLAQFRTRMENVHNLWMRLRTDVLLILCALAGQRIQEARDLLVRLLPDIEASGMPRLILDYHALQPLVARCPLPYAQRLAAHPEWKNFDVPMHPFDLSPQEMRVLKLLIKGSPVEAIAAELYLSVLTIRAHMRSIYKKLGVHSRAEAVRVAREGGVGEQSRESE
jgi:LuxR family maltose regulon positive regulatory protein